MTLQAVRVCGDQRDRLILAAVWRAWDSCIRPPSVRDLADVAGLASTAPTQARINKLIRDGWLCSGHSAFRRAERSLHPGPCFGGLLVSKDEAIPMERIG